MKQLDRTPEQVRESAAGLLEQIIALLPEPDGMSDIGQNARVLISAEGQQRTVTLVGEVNRGKTALANALVGEHGLGPTGAAATTIIPVAYGPASDALPAGQAALYGGETAHVVPATELGRWVTREQQRSVFTDGELPTRARVSVAQSPLGDATVIDTPGVGGLGSSISNVHPDTHSQASVLLVVTDAAAPISKPEMEFIRTAAARNDAVILAVTKIDKYLTGWQDIVQKDRDLILQHVGREIPVIPVSSILAVADTADLSSVDELREAIAQHFQYAQNLPAINALRIAAGALRKERDKLEIQKRILDDAEAVEPELEQTVQEWERLRKEQGRRIKFFEGAVTLAKNRVLRELQEELAEKRAEWTEFVKKEGMRVLIRDPKHYTRLIEEDLQRATLGALESFNQAMEEEVAALFNSPQFSERVLDEVSSQLESQGAFRNEIYDRRLDALDPRAALFGLSRSAGAAVVDLLLLPAILAASYGFTAMRQGKRQLVNWLNNASTAAVAHFNSVTADTLILLKPTVQFEYQDFLQTSLDEAKRQRADAVAAMRKKQSERDQERGEVYNKLQRAETLLIRAEETIGELRTAGA